jgi:hypothetical protein
MMFGVWVNNNTQLHRPPNSLEEKNTLNYCAALPSTSEVTL